MKLMLRSRRVTLRAASFFLIASQILLAGCGTTTLRLNNGSTVQGHVVREQGQTLVRTDEGDTVFDACQVEDVSHGGTSMLVWGGVAAGVGALLLAGSIAAAQNEERDDDHVGIPPVMVGAMGVQAMIGGGVLTTLGLVSRSRSKSAMEGLRCSGGWEVQASREQRRPRLQRRAMPQEQGEIH
jgi:hypothetical protein